MYLKYASLNLTTGTRVYVKYYMRMYALLYVCNMECESNRVHENTHGKYITYTSHILRFRISAKRLIYARYSALIVVNIIRLMYIAS